MYGETGIMASAVLLGLADDAVGKQTTNWEISKIGGKPDWISSDLSETIRCPHCQILRTLVCQVYCPLESSPYHRTLYVLMCTSTSCQNLPESWIAIRCQALDTAYAEAKTAVSPCSMCESWGVGQDDWGGGDNVDSEAVENPQATQSWCDDADNWGDDGVKSEDLPSEKLDIDHGDQSTDMCSSAVEQPESKEAHQHDATKAFSEMKIDDLEEEDAGNCCVPVSNCFAEDLSHIPESDINILGEAVESGSTEIDSNSSKCNATFPSFYISVIEESLQDAGFSMQHEKELLKEYSKREGVDLRQLADVGFEERRGAGGEKYEKTEVLHGDKTFHKFMKRIAPCPQQILRYNWNGDPLPIQRVNQLVVPPCENCRSPRVFELQLMPSLIHTLKLEGATGAEIEFGTVLIFSCKESCWADSDNVKIEHVIVQADPDQDMFKRQFQTSSKK